MSVDLLENCDECYQACLSEFQSSIVIKGGLAANTNYILKLIDKFGNKFSSPLTETDGSGNLTVAVPVSFPTAWFNRNAGSFKMEVSRITQPWTPEPMTLGTNPFTCILVQFVDDDSSINTIQ